MPRGARIQLPDDISHVVARGVGHQAIYRDGLDRRRFMRLLGKIVLARRWRCLTYCLMGNHYHLVVQLREPNLSVGMQELNGAYARWFNDRHGRVGHLFESRYWSKTVRHEAHMIGLARYVALNPVRAGVAPTPAQWRWSAHRALIGADPAWIVDVAATLSHFDEDPVRGRARYVDAVSGVEPPRIHGVDVLLAETMAWPERGRAVVRAHRELGYSVAQIAELLRCTDRTVRNWLARVEKGV
ncbi:MAG: toxin RelE [Solirubrobacterales bacterium]|nr:toxin RelE [Solirubrobacterales bacterium]